LVTRLRGDCGEADALTGFYFRETRYLSRLRLLIDGKEPWLCETASASPQTLDFVYIHPEMTAFSGGGSGAANAEGAGKSGGIPLRALEIHARHNVGVAGLVVAVEITSHALEPVAFGVRWMLAAD